MAKEDWDFEWFKERARWYLAASKGKLKDKDEPEIDFLTNFAIYVQDFLANERQQQLKALGIKKDEDLTHKERTAQLKEMLENKAKEYWKKTDGFLITEIAFTYYWGQYDTSPTPHCVIKQEYK